MGCKSKLHLSAARKSKTLLAKRRAKSKKKPKLSKIKLKKTELTASNRPLNVLLKNEKAHLSDTIDSIDSNEERNYASSSDVDLKLLEISDDDVDFEVEKENLSRSTEPIEGRRIVNIQYLFEQLFSFPHIKLFSCKSNDIEVIKEIRKGFLSSFVLQCKVCKTVHTVYSDKKDGNVNTNGAAVCGAMSIGCGFTQLNKFCANLNVPLISYRLYNKVEEVLHEVFQEECWESMLQAGREESNLAKEAGEVDEDGVPLITVIADGTWCKRSYKSSYNAKSGAACLIGERTGKLLFLGVRNKYCSMCNSSSPKEHKCFKNWQGPSTAMESDIIVEGFKSSLEMHGVKYAYLVGDGDSSVHKKILNARPYGSFMVKKVECSNHLIRNYCAQLRTLSQKQFTSKGIKIPANLKHCLKNNVERLRLAVRCAMKYRRSEVGRTEQKIVLLQKDIGNSINHVFGDHSNCDQYFCKGPKPKEINLIPDFKNCGLYNDISSYANRLIYHAHSLIKSLTNNKSENYNSIVAKHVGGKRVDFSRKGGYEMRCHAAGISLNSDGELISKIHKAICSKSPGKHTKQFIRQKKKNLTRKKLSYATKKRNKNEYCGPDEDYGITVDEVNPNEEEKSTFLQTLFKSESEITSIEKNTRGQSSCALWFEERKKRLTASTFGRICKLKESTDKTKTSKSILKGFKGSIVTQYGIEKEPIARTEFEAIIKQRITESGFFIDNKESHLGATPDGLIGNDGIVEIKCPYKARFFTPEEALAEKKIDFGLLQNNKFTLKRNHNYYYQVQGQLHISRRSYCFFVFWTPKGLLYEKILRDENFFKEKMQQKLRIFYYDFYLPEAIKYLRH